MHWQVKLLTNVDIELVVITAPWNFMHNFTTHYLCSFAQKVTVACRTRTYIYIYIYIESSTRQNLTPKPETFSMHLYTRTPLYSSSYKICVLLFISIFKSLVLVEVWFWTLNMDDNILHVALGQNVKEYKSILLWALQNSGGKTICVIHVHQPANLIPISKLPTF